MVEERNIKTSDDLARALAVANAAKEELARVRDELNELKSAQKEFEQFRSKVNLTAHLSSPSDAEGN